LIYFNSHDESLIRASRSGRSIDERISLGTGLGLRASALLGVGDRAGAIDLLESTFGSTGVDDVLRPMFVPDRVADLIASEPRLASGAFGVVGIGACVAPVGLTERERELLRMLLGDQGLRQIAAELGRTENTLKTHRRHLYRKLGVASRDEARALALRQPELLRDANG
ncbi:MAG: helix-turn-helix transcriptional regulator, partial [Pseudoclavibacter sp.]